jgi:parallel beta-helix repeat protein
MNIHSVAALLLFSLLATTPAARAAESYDNCNNFIDTLPATISTQGVWCLRHDLSTNLTSGAAITINANNVTVDCNDFKLGGLAAGDGSLTKGIYASNRQNATVRHCNVRGFRDGIALMNGAGHLIEDNRFDNNLEHGILVLGSDNTVRRNMVFSTGGAPGVTSPTAIQVYADVIDNTVSGVFGVTDNVQPYGIYVMSKNSEIRENRVRGLAPAGIGIAYGIAVSGAASTVVDNRVANGVSIAGTAIYNANGFCSGNTAAGYVTAFYDCASATGNLPATP